MRRTRSGLVGLLILAGVTATAPVAAGAQLISPGKLTTAHADLEGLRNCTQCHERRQKGAADGLCRSCHVALDTRITSEAGLHSQYTDQQCADCHKEHIGREADIVRFQEASFAHDAVGYGLEGAHGSLTCSDCHNRTLIRDPVVRRFKAAGGALDATFLGLATSCVACHGSSGPHNRQFEDRGCEACHTQDDWEGADLYDHDNARFRLTGLHETAQCASCHREERGASEGAFQRFRPLTFGTCTACHEDTHLGSMGTVCTTCHSTAGWDRIPRSEFEEGFDHARTAFELVGVHAEVDCSSCHQPPDAGTDQISIRFSSRRRTSSYPAPLVEDGCLSCHLNRHEGEFEDASSAFECGACHTDYAWTPSTFDLFRHEQTSFELQGAHLAVSCASCHVPEWPTQAGWRFSLGTPNCTQCHQEDDPHGGQFEERACTACHSEETFRIAEFDHDATGYMLEGAHLDAACESCHLSETTSDGGPAVRYRPVPRECESCHGDALGAPEGSVR